jgi:RNA polymerase sigma-70 factor (ECF subfamily)
MKAGDDTRIGKGGGRVPTTHWTVIGQIDPENAGHNQLLIGQLVRDYWKPVYCYLRRKGYGNEEAKDLTQGFFHEVVLGRKLIQRADPARGRFRTLVLTALDRYLINMHRAQTAQKRIPPEKLVSLQKTDASDLPQPRDFTSEDSFNYAWVSELLDRMLEEVEDSCRNRGMQTHWNLFHDRVLQPVIEDTEPPPLAEICARYGIPEATTASNMIFAVKKRFRSALRRHLRRSVASDIEIDEEMVELMQFLTRK